MQYLTEENVELLDHPPYRPDLSPQDFFTFPKIKNRLRSLKGSSHQKKQLTHSKMPFWVYQQTSGISASKIGSSTCRCELIFVEKTSKNNKVI
ncbi:unnamed protein product [Acanthoscelides obtectus]|uniref:Histone-lysine N-methyltransferase SETMAR n=1 Tax=Acanthoscelides obtectus TaxID=200917 RepID=A0A9P0JJN5_ACAOB|nr:unnamed protein product [Acanthoscelides obtectus]CAK1639922.1 hypothetical protein AOBTE_LOCUS11453 [Acanthoscelides obtectus]